MAKTQYTVRIDGDYLEKIRLIAIEENRSLNNMIECAVIKYVNDHEKNNGVISLPD